METVSGEFSGCVRTNYFFSLSEISRHYGRVVKARDSNCGNAESFGYLLGSARVGSNPTGVGIFFAKFFKILLTVTIFLILLSNCVVIVATSIMRITTSPALYFRPIYYE